MPLKVQKGSGKKPYKVVSKKTGKVVESTKSLEQARAVAKASYSKKKMGPLQRAAKMREMY